MDRCIICERSEHGGSLTITSEVRATTATWNAVSSLDELILCETDYARFTAFADAMANPDMAGTAMLGMPMRETPDMLGPDHCDCCQSELGGHASTIELVPTSQEYRRGSRTHRQGALRRLRVCRQCLTWWRSALDDPSAVLGAGWRETEGSVGGWMNPGHGDAATFSIRPRDEAILATTMEADGRSLRRISLSQALYAGEVAFVGTGKKNRATVFVKSLDEASRRRIAVVARPDQLLDASQALKWGAREMLASPLSPQQLIGAFMRAGSTEPLRRDAETGLVILGPAEARYGQSCLPFRLKARDSTQMLELALSARRFLRGYDEVGSDGAGGVSIYVYCDGAHAKRMLARIELLIGPGVQIVPGTIARAAA